MGIFWDIMQQDELDKQEKKARNLEERVGQLEADLATTRVLLRKTGTAEKNPGGPGTTFIKGY
ncbi:MAG: hypothetical protein EP302_03555 [Bacteroidetes bacterium]|nr:MAG: hypothetical protein EP302_03555 [Bacteroidota bacterium]